MKAFHNQLPSYTRGEEIVNTASHAMGALLALGALGLCVEKAAAQRGGIEIAASAVYGLCLILVYAVSSIYHGLKPSPAKRVWRVLDHCAIYFLIAGSYTVVCLGAIRRAAPGLGWGIFGLEWLLCAVAVALTALDMKRYRVFSMACYIGMGWAILPMARPLRAIVGPTGFWLILGGGLAYTVGAVLYALGKKVRWMHSVFHGLVLAGSALQFFAFYIYGI